MTYTPVIGLEIHVELATKSKIFCQCSADYFGKKPNTNTCPVCLGLPGALPVPNRKAVEWTVKIGQALDCTINRYSKFDRKHYFYPDLAKGYQISQYDEPLASKGRVAIMDRDGGTKTFEITRVHLEEDTGKLIHASDGTYVDFNRSGVPLVEIVTEPVFENSGDVKTFLEELHTIIRCLGVSEANMEEGSMRMEPNISLRLVTNDPTQSQSGRSRKTNLPKYKVEIKNINSFNFAKKAIEYELKRQAKILDEGRTPVQETRGYDEDKGITYSQRSKEEAHDYRYFPEPDIPPLVFTDDELAVIKRSLPELPTPKLKRFMTGYGLKYGDAFVLTRDSSTADYFEAVMKIFPKLMLTNDSTINIKTVGNDTRLRSHGQLIANLMNNKKIPVDLSPEAFADQALELSATIVADPTELNEAVAGVIQKNQLQVAQYQKGKTGILGFLVGQVMKEMKGKADPQTVSGLLRQKIEKS